MMKFISEKLIAELIDQAQSSINTVEKFKKLSEKKLKHKERIDKWSVLECIEHLNLYSDFYNSEIKKQLEDNHSKPNATFKSGMIGNYFVKSMLP